MRTTPHARGPFAVGAALAVGPALFVGALLAVGAEFAVGSRDGAGVEDRLWKACAEHVVMLRADPAPFRELAGAERPLQLVDGQAIVSILIQRCPVWRIAERDIGPSDEIHIWVALAGPESVRPIEGVAHMMPTRRWFSVYKGVLQTAPRMAYTAAGIPAVPIDAVELERSDDGFAGSVSIPGGGRFSWRAGKNEPPWPSLGVHHEVYGRDEGGRLHLTRVQGVAELDAWQAPGRLTIEEGIARELGPTPLLAPGTYRAQVHAMPILWAVASLAAPLHR